MCICVFIWKMIPDTVKTISQIQLRYNRYGKAMKTHFSPWDNHRPFWFFSRCELTGGYQQNLRKILPEVGSASFAGGCWRVNPTYFCLPSGKLT